jgi:hypothetical protein
VDFAITQYNNNSKSIKELGSLYDLIIGKYPLLQEQAEEILRAQFVLIVGAFDCYIHDCVQAGILEIYQGRRVASNVIKKYPVYFSTVQQIDSSSDPMLKLAHLKKAIYLKNTKESYQSPQNIENALGLINIVKIWKNLSTKIGMTADDIKNKLSLIINRRNKIAHESDRNDTIGGKYPINKGLVNDTINFIDKLSESIFQLL